MNIKEKLIVLILAAMTSVALVGCASASSEVTPSATTSTPASATTSTPASATTSTPASIALADGIYSAEFSTDSGMFHVNEANHGKGVLTVKDGKMTIHVSLASKGIVNLFVGTATAAQQDGAALLKPTVDSVTYSDGVTEEVYGFDIAVPAIDKEYAVALVGTKGKWYDHMVSVSNPVPAK
ncbi:MAG: hypothetical protein RR135_00615 [Oscillospiraceae bacterium]